MATRHAPRVLTKKLELEPERCVLIDNGVSCPKPRKTRGLCSAHLSYVRFHGLLERYALPATTGVDRRHRFALKPDPEPGVCRVVQDDEPCAAPAKRRGLCQRHYAVIWHRSKFDLTLDDFCLPVTTERDVRVRKRLVDGECRVQEAGEDCHGPLLARGLCKRHYYLKTGDPAAFLRVALPDPKSRRFELRKRLVEGRCRVLEDGEGCSEKTRSRGLCEHHYGVLGTRPDLMEEIALPAVVRTRRVYARAADPSPAPLSCLVLEDDVRCSLPPVYRGLCAEHHRTIGCHADHSLHDFLLPAHEPVLERKAAEATRDGRCMAIEDGDGCENARVSRGLCRRHYRKATATGRVDELGLAPGARAASVAYGAGNDRPHVYLDKNVLFDHADALVFQASGQWPSVTIVDQVIAGEARASISADAIKATYNHVRHRLQRPSLEGGRATELSAAEARARQYVKTTFLRGAWRVVALSPSEFLGVAGSDDPRLSFEDALEWQSYQLARSAPGGPAMFVTRDNDFPEGVHPSAVVQSFGWSS